VPAPDAATDGNRTPPVRVEIDEHEADVVRRVFRDYARGRSMKMIAHALNTDALPFPAKDTKRGPQRRGWAVSAIHVMFAEREVHRHVDLEQDALPQGPGQRPPTTGAPPPGRLDAPGVPGPAHHRRRAVFNRDIMALDEVDALAEAEEKAASKFGVTATLVALAARKLWGRSLTQERDRRVAANSSERSAGALQAIRGRVTRRLLDELEPILSKR
jgi:hypothetical protein